MIRSTGWALALLGVTACGNDSDDGASSTWGLAGIYETTLHTQGAPCDGAAMPLALDPPYFRVYDDSYFLDVYPCTSSSLGTCDDSLAFVFAAEKVENGHAHTEDTTITGTDTACSVEWNGYDVRKSGDGVTVSVERHTGEWTGAACAGNGITDAQVEMARSLPCDTLEIWTGRKVP